MVVPATCGGVLSAVTPVSITGLPSDARAASAWINPNPVSLSKPGAPMSSAVLSSAARICAGVRVGRAWSIRAATAAA